MQRKHRCQQEERFALRRVYLQISSIEESIEDNVQGMAWTIWYLSLVVIIFNLLAPVMTVASSVAIAVVACLSKTLITRWNHNRVEQLMRGLMDQPLEDNEWSFELGVVDELVKLDLVPAPGVSFGIWLRPNTVNAMILRRLAHGLLNLGRINYLAIRESCEAMGWEYCLNSNARLAYQLRGDGWSWRWTGQLIFNPYILRGLQIKQARAERQNQRCRQARYQERVAARKRRQEQAQACWLKCRGLLERTIGPIVRLLGRPFSLYCERREREVKRAVAAAQAIIAQAASEQALSRCEGEGLLDEGERGLSRLSSAADQSEPNLLAEMSVVR